MSLKTLIVSASCEERARIRKYLSDLSTVQIVGETPVAKEAIQLIKAISYDLLLTDVTLADMNGLEFAKSLTRAGYVFLLIFLADNENYAAEAFTLDAVDYLIKPVEKSRLIAAIERAQRWERILRKKEGEGREKISIPPQAFDENELFAALKRSWQREKRETPLIQKLPVEKGGRHILIPYSQIIFVEAYGDYTYIYTAEEKFFASFSLKSLEERFSGSSFFRVHRKYLVNLDQVVEIAPMPGGTFYLRTTGKHKIEIPISRRRLKQLKEILGL